MFQTPKYVARGRCLCNRQRAESSIARKNTSSQNGHSGSGV